MRAIDTAHYSHMKKALRTRDCRNGLAFILQLGFNSDLQQIAALPVDEQETRSRP
jgi:hypothetical protein